MASKQNITEVGEALAAIRRLFNTDDILQSPIGESTIIDYYDQSDYGYRLLHSSAGSIHMALNLDGQFDKRGYYQQAQIVEAEISARGSSRVLELASGKGFNLRYLAERDSQTRFTGIDITPKHIDAARRLSSTLPNLAFEVADFHQLPFADETFDLIFVVESLCHATDMQKALREIQRVAQAGASVVVIDGFRRSEFEHLDPEIQTAARLAELSMAVGHPYTIEEWSSQALDSQFKILRTEDFSTAIMPNLLRFQKMAKAFFRYRFASRPLLRVLPRRLMGNAIAGLLMPVTITAGAHGYYVIHLERP